METHCGRILTSICSRLTRSGPAWNIVAVPCRQGWNVKYKKKGKSLCTLYPMEGYFIALVVVGSRELTEAELLMPLCSSYVQAVFQDTKIGNGQKWLMLDVRDRETMGDIFSLIKLRKRI